MLELRGGRFQFLAIGAPSGDAVKPYPWLDALPRPVLRRKLQQVPNGWQEVARFAVATPSPAIGW